MENVQKHPKVSGNLANLERYQETVDRLEEVLTALKGVPNQEITVKDFCKTFGFNYNVVTSEDDLPTYLIERLGISAEGLKNVLHKVQSPVERLLETLLPNPNGYPYYVEGHEDAIWRELSYALREDEQIAIEKYYGFNGEFHTYQQIADEMGVTRQNIALKIKSAERKLRSVVTRDYLNNIFIDDNAYVDMQEVLRLQEETADYKAQMESLKADVEYWKLQYANSPLAGEPVGEEGSLLADLLKTPDFHKLPISTLPLSNATLQILATNNYIVLSDLGKTTVDNVQNLKGISKKEMVKLLTFMRYLDLHRVVNFDTPNHYVVHLGDPNPEIIMSNEDGSPLTIDQLSLPQHLLKELEDLGVHTVVELTTLTASDYLRNLWEQDRRVFNTISDVVYNETHIQLPATISLLDDEGNFLLHSYSVDLEQE